ncbi:MAG: LD-carboxypeptidase [Burkholderiales bacterium]
MSHHIYLYSPSGAVRDKAAFQRGVKRLEALGHAVEIDPAALQSHQRFAGDDAARLAAIGRAAASGADVALTSRGGYGLTRLLPQLPCKAIAKSIKRGTKWVGFSDFTALQLAVLAQTGARTWAGPALGEDFGALSQPGEEGAPDDIMLACFDDLLLGQGEGAGWRLPPAPRQSVLASSVAPLPTSTSADFHVPKALLWGGNLSVLASLLGTPYFPDKKQTRHGVLFLEDVGEHPYRIERLLTQLLHAGVLARQQAIVLGQFTGYQAVPHDRGFKLESVVQWLRSQLKIPVLTHLPFGHVPTKVLLPVGATVSLTVEGREALLFWGHHH